MAQPLAGLRVADFSHIIAGPLATQYLCLLGAEVIKVEPPGGDLMRYYTRRPEFRGMAEPFIGANAGKKSVVLDLKTADGRRDAQALAASADIFVQNFRPGVAERLGLGAQAATAANPSLIYCAISGYGQSGPMQGFPAIDQIIQSVSGLATLSGLPDDPPMRVGFPIVDTWVALMSAFAILAAVVQRQADPARRGQVVDVAMLDASMVLMASVIGPMLLTGEAPARTGNRGFSRAPTADTFDTWSGQITLGAVQQEQVERLFRAVGRAELLSDPRFATAEARMAHDAAVEAALTEALSARTAAEWEPILNAAGVPAGVVRSVGEALALPQLAGRDLVAEVPLAGGPLPAAKVLNAGFAFAHDGPRVPGPPPRLGEHTAEVLAALRADQPG